MRNKLYSKNYALLEKFVPEMLEEMPPTFSLKHIGTMDSRVCTFAERVDSNLVKVGTYWPINNEPACDPVFEVMFDNKRKMARVSYWATENIMFQMLNNGPIFDHYDCTWDSKETGREQEANDYLHDWLEEISQDRKDSPNYFEKIPAET